LEKIKREKLHMRREKRMGPKGVKTSSARGGYYFRGKKISRGERKR